MRISRCLLWGIMLLAAGARSALGDWHQPLSGGARGLRTVTVANDGAGGGLLRWVTLEGQVYSPWPQAGHADGSGAPPPGWSGCSFVPASYAADLDIASDGGGGSIIVTAEGGYIWAYHFRVDGGPDPGWPSEPIQVCPVTGSLAPRAAPDGAGGAFVSWQDASVGTPTAVLTHIGANGRIETGWPVCGKSLGTWPSGGNGIPELRSDGVGGVIVGLVGSDVRLFRFAGDGSAAAGWPAAGALVTTSATGSDGPRLTVASDAGTYLAWTEGVGGPLPLRSAPVRVLRITPDGSVDSRWPPGGYAFASGTDSLSDPAIVRDGAGGVYVVWGALSTGGARALRGARLVNDGSPAPGWTPDGINLLGSGASFALGNTIYEWDDPAVFAAGPDGTGGLFIAWDDRSISSTPQVRVSRFLSNGIRHPGWLSAGHLIPAPSGIGCIRAIEGNGAGDAFVAWRSITSLPFGTPMLSRVGPDVTADVKPAHGRSALALANDSENPARGALVFTCTLVREGAGRLELYDLSGRRLRSRTLEGPAGPRHVALAGPGDLPSGVVFARLSQGPDEQWLRVVVTK
jgi:hypothetical protein